MLKSKQYHYRTYLSLIMELFVHSELKMLENKKKCWIFIIVLIQTKPESRDFESNQMKGNSQRTRLKNAAEIHFITYPFIIYYLMWNALIFFTKINEPFTTMFLFFGLQHPGFKHLCTMFEAFCKTCILHSRHSGIKV